MARVQIFQKKAAEVLACQDNVKIPRHPDAGKIVDDVQLMHNGLKVLSDCYNGNVVKGLMGKLLTQNKGVHEPAEEFAFQIILKTMPESATIVELGAFWAFYSMWFCAEVKNPNAYMIEPIKEYLEIGKKHFAMNGFKGQFFNYFIGRKSGFWKETKRSLWRGNYEVQTDTPVICIDDFVEQNNIKFIDILHCDIQGGELDMLIGAERTIAQRKVRHFCVSTHGDRLHAECVEYLKAKKYLILCEADCTHAMHIDGYIIARAAEMPGPKVILTHKHS